MERACHPADEGPVTEMVIVNTFTKLIFGEEEDYTARELLIIQAFHSVDARILHNNPGEMGGYLRNLGVREMIELVSRLHQYLQLGGNASAPGRSHAVPPVSRSRTNRTPGAH